MDRNHPSIGTQLLAVGLPYFRSEARRKAYLGLGFLVLLLLAVNGLNVVNSYVASFFMTALAQRQADRFYTFIAILAGVFVASTGVEVLASYVQQRLGVVWREWLTRRFLDRYLAGQTYHRLAEDHEIDNPDERISDDVKTFTSTTLSFLVLLVNGLITLIAFLGVLWSITPWLVLTALGYSVAGSLGTILLGRKLVPLNNQQLQKEGDFRFALARLREHAGVIAQGGCEDQEKGRLVRKLTRLVANFKELIRVSRNLGFFTTTYNYMPQIIPILIVAPLYIHGQVEFGKVTQAAMAFSQVLGACSLVVSQFQQLSTYAAVIARLGSLWRATEPRPEPEDRGSRRPTARAVATPA